MGTHFVEKIGKLIMKFKYPVLSLCSGEPFCREGVIVIEWLMPEMILPRWYDILF